jgi:hypothetical protein
MVDWIEQLELLAANAGVEAGPSVLAIQECREKAHPLTDEVLLAAVETYYSDGLQAACIRIHDQFTKGICLGEYGELGVVLHNEEKDEAFVRLESFHGVSVYPSAVKVHGGEQIVGRGAGFTIPAPNLFSGLYGVMVRKNGPIVSNDCATDPQHIDMPKGHRVMTNLLGLPLWIKSGATCGSWHEIEQGVQVQDYPLGSAEQEMSGLFYVANRPGGFSGGFVRSLGALQWGLGLLLHIAGVEEARGLLLLQAAARLPSRL